MGTPILGHGNNPGVGTPILGHGNNPGVGTPIFGHGNNPGVGGGTPYVFWYTNAQNVKLLILVFFVPLIKEYASHSVLSLTRICIFNVTCLFYELLPFYWVRVYDYCQSDVIYRLLWL